VFEFIQRFFGKPPSSATAKERLRLVLLSDHLSLAPDVVEALKHDLIEVISRYVDVDATNVDVTFEQQEKQVAMLANIPILGMRARAKPPAPPSAASPPEPAPALTPLLDASGPTSAIAVEPIQSPEPAAPDAPPAQASTSATSANGRGKRRRRRQNPGISPGTSPAAPGFSGV
jgi:cell division topological specificity factor